LRAACIDIGSNTIALLVADLDGESLRPVTTRRRFALLGEGAGPQGLAEAKLDAGERFVAELAEFAREAGADAICVVATHVVREAANGGELAARVERRTGLTVEIIDGHTEARYSCLGATGGLERLRRSTIVIDAGGGSTEVTCARPGEPLKTASYPVGSAAIQRLLMPDDPPDAAQLEAVWRYADNALAELAEIKEFETALVVGGGASTARGILGGLIDRPGAERVLGQIAGLPAELVAERFGIELTRARLLPASLIVLATLADKLGLQLEVGLGGLREGVLIDRYGGGRGA